MLDRILSALGKCGIEDYHIVVKDEQSAELFFIKKELDMQRLKKVQTADVSVYHVFEEGTTVSGELPPCRYRTA